MGKPAVTMFVGVKIDDLSLEDEDNLPAKLRDLLRGDSQELEVKLQDLTFGVIDDGSPETSDPGASVGFGVLFFNEHYDSGVAECSPQKISDAYEDVFASVEDLFNTWGVRAKPQCYIVCHYS